GTDLREADNAAAPRDGGGAAALHREGNVDRRVADRPRRNPRRRRVRAPRQPQAAAPAEEREATAAGVHRGRRLPPPTRPLEDAAARPRDVALGGAASERDPHWQDRSREELSRVR